MRLRNRTQRGSTILELTFVMPVLIVILFAIVEFGIAFQRWQVVTNAAREGARAAVVRTGTCNAGIVDDVVTNYVSVAGMSAVTIDHSDPCVAPGEFVSVEVQHDFSFPVLAGLVPGLDAIPLRGRAVMRKE